MSQIAVIHIIGNIWLLPCLLISYPTCDTNWIMIGIYINFGFCKPNILTNTWIYINDECANRHLRLRTPFHCIFPHEHKTQNDGWQIFKLDNPFFGFFFSPFASYVNFSVVFFSSLQLTFFAQSNKFILIYTRFTDFFRCCSLVTYPLYIQISIHRKIKKKYMIHKKV